MTLSDKLKQLRAEKKLTRKAVAEQSGMSIATYSAYEDGKRLPKRNPENYDKLAAVLGCTAEYLKNDTAETDASLQSKLEKSPRKRAARKPKTAPADTPPMLMELQFGEQAIDLEAIAAKARALDGDITNLYIKPEENAVYYVAGDKSGSFELF